MALAPWEKYPDVFVMCRHLAYTKGMAKRHTIGIELTTIASRALDEVCKRTGIPKREVVSRALTWFARQDPIYQAIILDLIPDLTVDEIRRKAAKVSKRPSQKKGKRP